MIKYIFYALTASLVLLYVFVKLKFRFWSSQPVFHIYNLRYWLFPPGLLQHDMPPKTTYYSSAIECDTFDKISTEKKALMCSLIKSHFLYRRKARYAPTTSSILNYFKYHTSKPFISLNFRYISEIFQGNQRFTKQLISCMSSRTLYGHLHDRKIQVSYVDFLCVHKKHRKKGVAPVQIYTHYYKSREKGADPIFLFKREGNVNFMVPVTIYYAYAISTKKWDKPNTDLPNNISCHIITDSNVQLLIHYLEDIRQNFSCFIIPELSNLQNLIRRSLIIPLLILDDNTPVGAYFYRCPHTVYSGKQSIECVASYCKKGYEDILKCSFRNTIALLKRKYKFSIVIIENISNNHIIIKGILKRDTPKWTCPMAYYFYNFAYRPFFSPNVFILN